MEVSLKRRKLVEPPVEREDLTGLARNSDPAEQRSTHSFKNNPPHLSDDATTVRSEPHPRAHGHDHRRFLSKHSHQEPKVKSRLLRDREASTEPHAHRDDFEIRSVMENIDPTADPQGPRRERSRSLNSTPLIASTPFYLSAPEVSDTLQQKPPVSNALDSREEHGSKGRHWAKLLLDALSDGRKHGLKNKNKNPKHGKSRGEKAKGRKSRHGISKPGKSGQAHSNATDTSHHSRPTGTGSGHNTTHSRPKALSAPMTAGPPLIPFVMSVANAATAAVPVPPVPPVPPTIVPPTLPVPPTPPVPPAPPPPPTPPTLPVPPTPPPIPSIPAVVPPAVPGLSSSTTSLPTPPTLPTSSSPPPASTMNAATPPASIDTIPSSMMTVQTTTLMTTMTVAGPVMEPSASPEMQPSSRSMSSRRNPRPNMTESSSMGFGGFASTSMSSSPPGVGAGAGAGAGRAGESESSSSTGTPALIGGVVGGIAGLAALLLLALLLLRYLRRRRERALEDGASEQGVTSGAPTPTFLPGSAAGIMSRMRRPRPIHTPPPAAEGRGFERISGRKLPSQFSPGMEGPGPSYPSGTTATYPSGGTFATTATSAPENPFVDPPPPRTPPSAGAFVSDSRTASPTEGEWLTSGRLRTADGAEASAAARASYLAAPGIGRGTPPPRGSLSGNSVRSGRSRFTEDVS